MAIVVSQTTDLSKFVDAAFQLFFGFGRYRGFKLDERPKQIKSRFQTIEPNQVGLPVRPTDKLAKYPAEAALAICPVSDEPANANQSALWEV